MKSVVITNATSIPDYAFYDCYYLTSITIPETVTSIGYYAFYNCQSLRIFCGVDSQPDGWNYYWNSNGRPVVWGYDGTEHTYTFDTNGGDAIDTITSSLTIELPTPTYEGYYFGGWYLTSDFSGEAVSSPYYNSENVTLYARWLDTDGTSFETAFEIASGETQTVVIDEYGEYVYFVFTPTYTGYHSIYSQGSYDTYGYIYNSSQSQLAYNDDGGTNANFSFSHYMYAGSTYYIGVRMYSSSQTGTFTITVN